MTIFDTNSEPQAFSAITEFPKPHVSLSNEYNGNEFVDLGLPSGTLWAKVNVGANSETDNGLYFQWGDTVGYIKNQVGRGEEQKSFGLADYKYNKSRTNLVSASTMTKYNADDGLTVLLESDDAAVANMGGSWRMPTEEEYQELLDNTTNKWVDDYNGSGVNGRLFTSKVNSRTLFFPTSGFFFNGNVYYVGSSGDFWCSSLGTSNVLYGRSLNFCSGNCNVGNGSRYGGRPVRGVVPK